MVHMKDGYKWQWFIKRVQGNIAHYKSIIFPPQSQHYMTVYLPYYVPEVAAAKANEIWYEEKKIVPGV